MSKEGKLKTELVEVDLKEIELLKVNARYMPPEMYARLVENIRADGCLTSVPLCYRKKNTDKLICISGNHRTKAAIDAGLKKITVQVITTEISQDDFIAKQLSHNSLSGLDNEDILRILWDKMQSADAKLYSGLHKADVEGLDAPAIPPIDAGLDFEQITLLFVGNEKNEVEGVLQEVRKRGILSKENWIAALESYQEVAEVIQRVCEKERIHNHATAVVLMARYAKAYLDMQEAAKCG